MSKNKPDYELISLTRSFSYAGTPSVLVSLWAGEAASMLELMVDFLQGVKVSPYIH
jgi:CHAT domain-containing protein